MSNSRNRKDGQAKASHSHDLSTLMAGSKMLLPADTEPKSFADHLLYLKDSKLGIELVAEQQGLLFDEAHPDYGVLDLREQELSRRIDGSRAAIVQLEQKLSELAPYIEVSPFKTQRGDKS